MLLLIHSIGNLVMGHLATMLVQFMHMILQVSILFHYLSDMMKQELILLKNKIIFA